jgi:TolA-binding protein
MKKIFFAFFTLLFCAASAFSQNIAQVYDEATQAYNSNEFARAYLLFSRYTVSNETDVAIMSSARYYIAECLMSMQQNDAAINAYEDFLNSYSWSNFREQSLYKLAGLYFEKKEYSKSREKYKELIERFPDSRYMGAALFFTGETYTYENNINEAINFFRESITNKKKNKFTDISTYSLANLYEKTGDYRNAVANYDSLLAYFKNSSLAPASQVRIGLCYFLLKAYDNSILELTDPLIDELPEEQVTEAKYILANSYYRVKEYDNALKIFDMLSKNRKKSKLERAIVYGLAWTNFQKENFNEAYKNFNILSKGSKNDSLTVYSRFYAAECKRYAGKVNEAYTLFNKFIDDYPDSKLAPAAKLNKGFTVIAGGKPEESEEIFVDLSKTEDPSVRSKAFLILGEISLNQSDYSKAVICFDRVLENKAKADDDISLRAFLGSAISLFYLNKFDSSLAILKNLNEKYTQFESDKVNFYIAENSFGLSDYKNAKKYYYKVDNKNKELYNSVILGKAYSAFNTKDYRNALGFFNEYLSQNKTGTYVAEVRTHIADCYYAQKKYKEAGEIYKGIFLSDKDNLNRDYANYQYAQALFKSGNSNEAIEEFSNMPVKFPSSKYLPESKYFIGWIHFIKGEYYPAITNYLELVETYRNSAIVPLAFNSIAKAFFNADKFDSAIRYYGYVVRDFPKSIYVNDAATGIQNSYIAMGNTNMAISFIDDFVQNYPESEAADKVYFRKGEIYYNQRSYGKAIDAYKEFIEKYPKSEIVPDAYYWIGKANITLHEYENAAASFNIVCKDYLNTKSGIKSTIELGKMLTDLKKYDEAVTVYQNAIGKIPESPEIPKLIYDKAMVQIEKGDIPGAYESLNNVVQNYDGTVSAVNAKFQLGMLELTRESYETANILFKDIAENNSDVTGAKAQYYWGLSLFKQGSTDDAITAFVRVKFVFPTFKEWYSKSMLQLGECYEKKKDIAKAREIYQAVLKTNRGNAYSAQAQKKLRSLK